MKDDLFALHDQPGGLSNGVKCIKIDEAELELCIFQSKGVLD